MADLFDRAYGCLLGQAIGDSFGFSYEYQKVSCDGNSLPSILGGRGMEPGQVTDDTEMAMALARSLRRCRTFDQCDVARSYAHWFYSEPPDIGVTTYQSFRKMPESKEDMVKLNGETVRRKMLFASDMFNKSSLSNGCVMRISPLAIAGHRWPANILREAAKADCRLTHPNSGAQDAVATYVNAISTLINTGDREKAFSKALDSCETSRVRRLLEVGNNSPIPVPVGSDDEEVKFITGDDEMMGYLGIALKWAFYELRNNGDNFAQALISVVSRGGDTDTNGCISGALIGAAVGASKIPLEWKRCVLEAKPRRENYDDSRMNDAEDLVRDLLICEEPALNTLF